MWLPLWSTLYQPGSPGQARRRRVCGIWTTGNRPRRSQHILLARRPPRPLEFTERGLLIRAGQSLWLDAGEPDHLAPFFGFVGDQLAERGRRTRQRHVAEVGETGPQLGIGKTGVDRFVQNLDNLGRG